MTNFPIINIFQKDINYPFELTSYDLFEEIEDRKYFLVNFANNSGTKWILGKPFLKKYNFTFNFDSKAVGLFFGTKDKQEKTSKDEFNKVWIYVIISVFIILVLIGIIIIIVKKIPRKKRVNELEENFDYQEKKNHGNNKVINNENNESQNSLGIED